MLPVDLNLPGSFTSYREGQLETAISLASSTKRFRLLSAPPGRGKSLINMTVARLRESDGRTLILTGTKSLQSQMVADFQAAGLSEVKGLSNYRCVAVDRHLKGFSPGGSTCDLGPCRAGVFCNYKQEGGCLYYDAQAQAAQALVVVTNYAYWMALGRSPETAGLLGEFDTIILDECHSAPSWLTNFCSVSLDKDEVNDLLGLNLPPINEGVAVWAEWAGHAQTAAQLVTDATKTALEKSAALKGDDRSRLVKRILRLRDIERGLGELASAGRWKRGESTRRETRMPGLHTDWVAEKYETRTERGVRFTPVWPHNYAEQYIYRSIPNVILTSGTMTKDIMQYMGISPAKAEFTELDSSFDPKRHPTYIIPKVRVDRNNGEGEKRQLVSAIDHIIAARPDRKGLIHARSYDRAKDIIRLSKHSSIMMSHSTGGLATTVGKFKKADAPSVLVSPSATEGIDLPYDDCRYVIIVKVPFIDGRSELVKARSASDRNYVNYEAALAMVQMAGRGMRAEDDSCECVAPGTLILTDDLRWVPARELKVGQRLLAFDEEPQKQGRGHGRRWQWSTIEKIRRRELAPRVEVGFEGGAPSTVCTPNHPWLVYGRNGLHTWKQADQLKAGDKLIRLLEPWADEPHADKYGLGWLAGIVDGEGCLTLRHGTRNPNVTGLWVTQNVGKVLDAILSRFAQFGFKYGLALAKKAKIVKLLGGFSEILRFLGTVRPVRLLDKFSGSVRNEKMTRMGYAVVSDVRKLENGPIISLQTSSRTYIADGFAAHNCFILDAHMEWFMDRAKWPRWFMRTWKRMSTYPPPLRLEAL